MKTVIEMAREAGGDDLFDEMQTSFLERFAELIRADERNSWPAEMEAMERQVNILTDALAQAKAEEREACAKVCDDLSAHYWAKDDAIESVNCEECATAIRSRSSEHRARKDNT